ncbi:MULTISPECIES: hypothetical protein [unclassified Mesorhizobium]|uniref:hypothetical protein n=1 Tax=unclassified Mesorhizobium TaxID=325217 RepID=UPI0015E27B4A|nr:MULTISPECIES: hypothetical protein [unclassified Mesorhizobium]MBZ9699539.1 hypothetical protein [Mesorhizobium sp. CO1-1-3]MBZ9945792.1 hypothetical protein [Mesorhizobium sp. BR1-1-11]
MIGAAVIQERVTTGVAAAATTNILWLPYFQDGASLTLTVLGIVWLAVQIYYKVWRGK